jgi:hypothetical protein
MMREMAKKAPGQSYKNGHKRRERHKSAVQEMNDYVIAYVNSVPELMEKAAELMEVQWRTVDIPTVAHMTVVWAGYTDTEVLVEVAVKDSFAKRIAREYFKGAEKKS